MSCFKHFSWFNCENDSGEKVFTLFGEKSFVTRALHLQKSTALLLLDWVLLYLDFTQYQPDVADRGCWIRSEKHSSSQSHCLISHFSNVISMKVCLIYLIHLLLLSINIKNVLLSLDPCQTN